MMFCQVIFLPLRFLNPIHGIIILGVYLSLCCGCHHESDVLGLLPIRVVTTSGDRSLLFSQSSIDFSARVEDTLPVIHIDPTKTFQSVDGFGFTLTGSSALLLHQLSQGTRHDILKELFGAKDSSIDISCLRLSIGASDLDPEVFSYDDLPPGKVDPQLKSFSLSRDTLHLIPILKEILAIQADLMIIASPWSPPPWMKTNLQSNGGSLLPAYYETYALYLTHYISLMASNGITIDAITIQNEPQNDKNNPSLLMSSREQANFIKNHLGPLFRSKDLKTKILIWDHNCDQPEFPLEILSDTSAYPFVSGSAFHLYGGDIHALSRVHDSFPAKDLYFTEQWTGAKSDFEGDLNWHIKNVIIGSMRHWSRTALEWNLANDIQYGPHTDGGCTECLGSLTIDGEHIQKNVAYYIIAHASKYVVPGSIRIDSNMPDELANVAFITPGGKTVLIVLNESIEAKKFNIEAGGKIIQTSLIGKAVATYEW